MAFTKKTWKNRISEYPNRRILTDTTTSEQQVVTVTRSEGSISQEGDAFSATNLNDLEDRIKAGFDSISYGTSLPESGEEGDIFFLYEE